MNCVIKVQISGLPMITNWYRLWGKAVAVVAMCVLSGRNGAAKVTGILTSSQKKLRILMMVRWHFSHHYQCRQREAWSGRLQWYVESREI